MEQLSLFGEDSGQQRNFYSTRCYPDLSPVTEGKRLVLGPDFCLTKRQLLDLGRQAIKTERFAYGYRLYIRDGEQVLALTARLGNHVTRSGESAADYFNRCFDEF